MPDLDALAPNYRRAQLRWPAAPTLLKCHEALRGSFDATAHGLVEHVKSFIESVCITIMGELREPLPPSKPSTTDLLVAALNSLGLRNMRGASKLDKVLSGFNKLADALTEMRNDNGPVAHGKDAFLDAVTVDHARAFLHAGDAILSVLLNAFEGKQPDLTVTREPYESFPHLNTRIDRAVRVEARVDDEDERPMVVLSFATRLREVFDLRVEPSRLLYGIDRSAYIDVLETVDLVVAGVAEGEDEEEAVVAPAEPVVLDAAAVDGPLAELVPSDGGQQEALCQGLSELAKDLRAAGSRGEQLGLSADELAFYDALETNDSAVQVLGDETLRAIARELVDTLRKNVTVDWMIRENVRAQLRVLVKRILRKHGYPPDKQEKATQAVLEKAEVLSEIWAGA